MVHETNPTNLLPMAEASCACCAPNDSGTSLAAAPASLAGVTATYAVAGMTCSHCANSVTAEVEKLPGVSEVEVDVATGQVTVTSDAPLEHAAVAAAVDEAGYEVVSA